MQRRIPFNKPFIAGKELYYVAQAVTLGNIAGDGHFTRSCSRILEERFGIHKVLLTPSCTAALEMAAMLCDIGPGDEVILPSFTFVSTANAIVRLGAKPIFVDIRPDTLNLDERLIEAAITPKTKAILPVHYAGVACEMDEILAIAQRHGVHCFEDAAQGVHAFYRGRALGSLAPLGAYSFHETKNYTCGEGGALCINDPALLHKAEIIRDKGTNRSQFLRGEVDKYTWVDVGSSYVPSEVASAFLYAQLEMLDAIAERRRQIDLLYRQELAPLTAEGLVQLPYCPPHSESNYHMFYVMLADAETRNALMAHLKAQNIGATFHYIPLHDSPMGRKLGCNPGPLPVTESISARLLRLPFYYEITPADQAEVVHQIGEFFRLRRPAVTLASGQAVARS
ncbi:MAG: dTDP-4-amino-4,6-dideoxygalactose transaminase [Pirellulales bacterium]|nr:dTDP-4-amino-4,6-dideoxygalactose transaminase [Pirellulales bacterium]